MKRDNSIQRKAALREAKGTWVSPMSLSLLMAIAFTLTVIFNGI